jgi:hypothetical protein
MNQYFIIAANYLVKISITKQLRPIQLKRYHSQYVSDLEPLDSPKTLMLKPKKPRYCSHFRGSAKSRRGTIRYISTTPNIRENSQSRRRTACNYSLCGRPRLYEIIANSGIIREFVEPLSHSSNGAKTQLLIYTNTNLLLNLCILLGLFNRGY